MSVLRQEISCLNINCVVGRAIWKFLCSKEAFPLVVAAFSEESAEVSVSWWIKGQSARGLTVQDGHKQHEGDVVLALDLQQYPHHTEFIIYNPVMFQRCTK